MKQNTILYIGGFELPDKNAAAHRVLANGKIFRELGYNVVFIDVDKSLKYNSDILDTKKIVQDFDCWSVPYPSSKKEWFNYLVSIEKLNKILEKYKDVKYIICYNYQSVAFKRIYNDCQKKNIKVIGDCTEWYSSKGNGLLFFIFKKLDTFYRMRVLHKKLDGLIVISDYLEIYYKKSKNLLKLPPLVDLNEDKWIGRLNKNNIVTTFVYAGSPGNKDKIDYIIEAFNNLKLDFRFDIIGLTKEQYLSTHQQHIEILDELANNIYFYGRLNHNESLQFVKNADYTIFTREKTRSNQAGFPTKFVESISLGTPVICNDSSNIKKYIDKYQCGICINEIDTNNITNVLSNAINNINNLKINNRHLFEYNKYKHIVSEFLKGV